IVPSNPGAPPAKREGIHPWSSPPSVALGLGSLLNQTSHGWFSTAFLVLPNIG
uniref:Uncharacterized protein n=1 Tax=Aegilops tauschii subsp. strangulata TaxID=200361 RepID=A0A453K379_AEGTS